MGFEDAEFNPEKASVEAFRETGYRQVKHSNLNAGQSRDILATNVRWTNSFNFLHLFV